jgi:N-acetylglutamate synthase-like GNAT family acetyltransferase
VIDRSQFVILHDSPPSEIESLWREFLRGLDYPAHYDSPEYFREPYWEGKSPFAVLALDNGRIAGVLTGIHTGDHVCCGLPSRPQIYPDPRCDAFGVSKILMDGLLREANQAQLITVFSWAERAIPAFQQGGFRVRQQSGIPMLDLRIGADALFSRFSKNCRRDIRAAFRKGVEVSEVVTEQDLLAYWQVYSAWKKTKRKKITAESTFAEAERTHQLRGNRRRFLARYQGKAIAAAGFRFCPKGLIEYAGNCSVDEFLHLLPNDMLIWKAIQWACDQGFTRLSLGGSHPFLLKTKGTITPICRYRLDRSVFHRIDLGENLREIARRFANTIPTAKEILKGLVAGSPRR